MRRRSWLIFVVIGVAYIGSYAWFRSSHTQVWEKDGKAYVIFPEGNEGLYYVYRPMTYLDGALTAMRFHIGPHR
jgi:hypothetical protein